MLKECSSEIAPILALIYNETLAQGTVPDDWRQTNVAPIFKKGEKYDAANYRPVSLTCICCKTLEHIIISNINKHLAFESILADCQHGFEVRGPAKPNWYNSFMIWLDRVLGCNHRQTHVIIMDFAKTFDKVPHRSEAIVQIRLLRGKRIYTQVDHSMALWALSESGVRWQSLRSSPGPIWCPPRIGLRAGPISHFINDFPENIRSSVRLFADDCVLYRNIESPTDCQILQDDLNRLACSERPIGK